MLLADTHLTAWVSVPGALVLAALALIQLLRAVAPGTPPSRTRIRRASMGVRIALLVPVVIGLSFADPATDPLRYVWSWAAAMVLLAISFVVTSIDMVNNLRVRAIAQQELALGVLAQSLETVEASSEPPPADETKG